MDLCNFPVSTQSVQKLLYFIKELSFDDDGDEGESITVEIVSFNTNS